MDTVCLSNADRRVHEQGCPRANPQPDPSPSDPPLILHGRLATQPEHGLQRSATCSLSAVHNADPDRDSHGASFDQFSIGCVFSFFFPPGVHNSVIFEEHSPVVLYLYFKVRIHH